MLFRSNPHAEWNFYLDPVSVQITLAHEVVPTLVPLDATKTAAIRNSMIGAISGVRSTEASRIVHEIVGSVKNWINAGHYFAWDAVAAVLLLNPEIGCIVEQRIKISTDGEFSGRTQRSAVGSLTLCFMNADIDRFEDEFVSVLMQSSAGATDA